LRLAGIDAPILVMGYTAPEHATEAARLNVSLAVFRQDAAQAYALAMVGEPQPLRLHVKVDTGMGRLGVFPEDAATFVNQLRITKNLLVGRVVHAFFQR